VLCKQWCVREDPEVSTATGLFRALLNSILSQLPLQLQRIFQCNLVVSVNCHSRRALRLRIQRVDANGELTAQMLANGLERQPTAAFYWLAPDQRKPTANVPV
jgi:hypothetical protein